MQIKYKIVHVCSVPSQRYQPIPIPFSLLALIKLVNKRNRVVLCILLRLMKQFLWSQSTHNLSFIKFIAVANKHFASQNGRKISCDFHVILILGRGFEDSRCWAGPWSSLRSISLPSCSRSWESGWLIAAVPLCTAGRQLRDLSPQRDVRPWLRVPVRSVERTIRPCAVRWSGNSQSDQSDAADVGNQLISFLNSDWSMSPGPRLAEACLWPRPPVEF